MQYRLKCSGIALVSFVLYALCSGAVHAEEKSATARADAWLLAKYDTDGDHVITLEEIGQKRERMFGFMDQDENGEVDFTEYQSLDTHKRAELLKARFFKLDLDQDGALSAAEYNSYLGSFDRFDSNKDGRLTQGEMVATPTVSAQKADVDLDVKCFWRVCLKTD